MDNKQNIENSNNDNPLNFLDAGILKEDDIEVWRHLMNGSWNDSLSNLFFDSTLELPLA